MAQEMLDPIKPAAATQDLWGDLAGELGVSLDNDAADAERVLAGHEREMQNMMVNKDQLDPGAQQMIEEYRAQNGHQPVDDYGWLAKTLDVPAQAVNGLVDAVAAMKDLTFDVAGAGARTLYVDALGVANTSEVDAELQKMRTGTEANALADAIAPGARGGVDLAQPFGAPKSTVGNVTESISQFMAPFAALGKVKYLQSLGKAAPIAKGMLADFVAFDEHEKRLSNVINEMGWGSKVTEYLAADANDTWAEGRFKNVLEGAGLGAMTDAVFHGVKYIKDGKAAKQWIGEMRTKANGRAEEIRTAAGQIDGYKTWMTGTLKGEKLEVPADLVATPAKSVAAPATALDRYLDVTYKIEGTGKNPTSSAVGPFQFTNSTWLEEARLANPDLKAMPDKELLALRKDPAQAEFVRTVGKNFTQRNVDYLTENGVEVVDEPTMYLSHFLGKGDAVKVLKAADDAPVAGLVDADSIKANKSILAGKTVGQVKEWARTVYAKRAKQIAVGATKAPAADETLAGFRPNKEVIDLATQERVAAANGTTLEDLKAGKVFEWARERGLEPVMNKVTLLERDQFNKTAEALGDYIKRADAGDASAADQFWRNEGAALLEVAGHAKDVFQSPARVMGFRGNTKEVVKINEVLKKINSAGTDSKEALMRTLAEMVNPAQVDSLVQQVFKSGKVTNDLARMVYTNNVLSSPITQIVDIAGSILFTSHLALERLASGVYGNARVSLGFKKDQARMGEGAVMVKSYFGSIMDGFSLIAQSFKQPDLAQVSSSLKGVLKSGVNMDTRLDNLVEGVDNLLPFNRKSVSENLDNLRFDLGSKFDTDIDQKAIPVEAWGLSRDTGIGRFIDYAGTIVSTPSRFMRTKDDINKAILYQADVRAQAYRQAANEGLTGTAREVRENQLIKMPLTSVKFGEQNFKNNKLIQIAEGLVKGDDTGLAANTIEQNAVQFAKEGTFTDDLGSAMQNFQDFLNAVPGGFLVITFLKTPTKLMVRTLERTPLAPMFKQVRDDLAAGGARHDLAMGRMAAGSSIMGLGWYLASAGLITGNLPEKAGLREGMQNYGIRANSFKIGEKYFNYGRLDPLASLLSMPANIVSLYDEFNNDLGAELEKDLSDYYSLGALAFTNMLMSKTWTQSIAQIMEAVNRKDENGMERIMQYWGASAAVPNAVTFFATQVNPVVQEAETLWEAIKIKAGYPVREKLNIWGNPVQRDPQLFYGLPAANSEISDDPLHEKLLRSNAYPGVPRRRIAEVEITKDEHNQVLKIMKEKGFEKEMRKLTESPLWLDPADPMARIKDEQRGFTNADMAKSVYKNALEYAQKTLVSTKPDLAARIERHKRLVKEADITPQPVQRALGAQGFNATGGGVKVDFGLGRAQ